MKSAFKKAKPAAFGTGAIVSQLVADNKGRGALIDSSLAGKVLAMEHLGEAQQGILDDALAGFRNKLKTLSSVGTLSVAQEEAAEAAAILGSNPRAYVTRQMPTADAIRAASAQSGQMVQVVPSTEGVDRMVSMEAFDERANSNAMVFSAAYNIQSAKQNEFGEAFYPTITIAPDQVGFNVGVKLLLAYNEVTRSPSGALSNFGRKNIIRAIIDSTILAVDQTKLIPVYRSGGGNDNTANFVAGIATTTLVVDNADLPTRPLAVGKKFDLLALSQTDASLAAGVYDQTDAVDSSARLAAVYLKVVADDAQNANASTTEYFKFDVKDMPTSDFNAAVQGNTRLLTLRFDTKSLKLTSATKTTADATSALLDALSTNTVRLGVTITGEITQDVGTTFVNATPVTIEAVNDASGAAISTASGPGAAAAAILADISIVGFDLLAYRTNSNRRNRGKLIDTQHLNFLYTMPLLPPITALRPVTAADSEDGGTLSTLVTTTRTQCSNAAVTALLNAKAILEAHASNGEEATENQPLLFGAASLLVTPSYLADSIDCASDLDSLTSSGRVEDLVSMLINKIRDMSARLYVSAGYGPALEAMYEGTPPKTTVIIGTDPIIARYLVLNGDTRLTGEQFDYKIVPSYDLRMAGKIVFSFGLADAFNSGVVNPLHFGNMGWRPELTLMLPMVRNGNQVMELTVQPSYRHVNNLPVMGYLTVANIDTVIGGKVAINNNPV